MLLNIAKLAEENRNPKGVYSIGLSIVFIFRGNLRKKSISP